MLNDLVIQCNYLLNTYPGAFDSIEYLKSRINTNTIETFKFGYFPSINELSVLTTIYSEENLIKSNFISKRIYENSSSKREIIYSYFENYPIIIPFRDVYGDVVGLVGRTLLSSDEIKEKQISKYKNSSEKHNINFKKGNHLFGLFENKQSIIDQNCVFVVEGQFDVIKAYESGFKNVVALSNSNMTQHQLSMIMRYTDNIFLLLDNDQAGEKGRKRIVDLYKKYANIKNFYIPMEYKDIDEYLSHNKYEDLSLIIKD